MGATSVAFRPKRDHSSILNTSRLRTHTTVANENIGDPIWFLGNLELQSISLLGLNFMDY